MNLVCYSNQTAGALVCNLLNGITGSQYDLYRINSVAQGRYKIGDCLGVFRQFNEELWLLKKREAELRARLGQTDQNGVKMEWVGTHCHPSCIPEKYRNQFEKVMGITVTTKTSKFLKFLRIFHGIYKIRGGVWNAKPVPITNHSDEYYIKEKYNDMCQLFKWATSEFEAYESCINVEFEDIINGNFVSNYNLAISVFNEWKDKNSWLYVPASPAITKFFYDKLNEGE